jgi:hypothetical protein
MASQGLAKQLNSIKKPRRSLPVMTAKLMSMILIMLTGTSQQSTMNNKMFPKHPLGQVLLMLMMII